MRTAKITALAVAYFVSAKLGLLFSFANESVTAIWPPTGLALAAVLIWGYRVWPGIAIGAFAANATTAGGPDTALLIATGNTLEALCGAKLLSLVSFRPSLERVRDVLALTVLAAGLSTVVSATIGVAALLAAGLVDEAALASTWRVWWLGDAGGDLFFGAGVLILATRPAIERTHYWVLEALLSFGALATGSILVFSQPDLVLFPYLLLPLLFWVAFRFRQFGAVVGGLTLASVAILYTAQGSGPFASGGQDTDLLQAQLFVGVVLVSALAIAAIHTHRARAEEAERMLAEAQRLTHIGSWEWEVAADRLSWSEEISQIFGDNEGRFDATRAGLLRLVHPDDRAELDRVVDGALQSGEKYQIEHRILRPDGEIRTVEARGEPILDGETVVRLRGTARDVTEKRRAEAEALRAKDQLMALVSHELLTPLIAIHGYLDLLRDEGGADLARDHSVAAIDRQITRLKRLAEDLLYAYGHDRPFVIERAETDIQEVISASVEGMAARAAEKDIELELTIEPLPRIQGDPGRLGQAVDNVVGNAIKFTPQGGRIRVSLRPEGGMVVLTIEDTGVGVPAAELTRIFQPFYRSSSIQTASGGGVGLGLAIVKAIVEAHDGTVGVQSEPGTGTTITIAVPAEEGEVTGRSHAPARWSRAPASPSDRARR